jgi:hypothetical protein
MSSQSESVSCHKCLRPPGTCFVSLTRLITSSQTAPGSETVKSREQLKAEVAALKQEEQDLVHQLAALEKQKDNLDQVRWAREEAKVKDEPEQGGLVAEVLGSLGGGSNN